tara:strand:- start:154 stop:1011 length:858 start_codon:yes stop_codon:yes gene_type:complete
MNLSAIWPKEAPPIDEAKKFLEKYKNKKIVLKYGGQVMASLKLSKAFAEDAAVCNKIGINTVVVHGGGPQIQQKLNQNKIESKFIDGLRVTDNNIIGIVEDVLLNEINPDLVKSIEKYGVNSVPVNAKNSDIIRVKGSKDSSLGFVADPDQINEKIINDLLVNKKIPVIAPIGIDKTEQVYNINADTVAGKISEKIKADRLLLMTDVPGVNDKCGKLIEKLTISEANNLISKGVITGGMIPKILTCISCLKEGVSGVVIIDGRKPHAVLYELFSEAGAGTLIVND